MLSAVFCFIIIIIIYDVYNNNVKNPVSHSLFFAFSLYPPPSSRSRPALNGNSRNTAYTRPPSWSVKIVSEINLTVPVGGNCQLDVYSTPSLVKFITRPRHAVKTAQKHITLSSFGDIRYKSRTAATAAWGQAPFRDRVGTGAFFRRTTRLYGPINVTRHTACRYEFTTPSPGGTDRVSTKRFAVTRKDDRRLGHAINPVSSHPTVDLPNESRTIATRPEIPPGRRCSFSFHVSEILPQCTADVFRGNTRKYVCRHRSDRPNVERARLTNAAS